MNKENLKTGDFQVIIKFIDFNNKLQILSIDSSLLNTNKDNIDLMLTQIYEKLDQARDDINNHKKNVIGFSI